MTTYKVSVDSCEACPKIVATFEDVPQDKMEQLISIATSAFRSVEIINNETGEVELTHYEGTTFHKKSYFGYGEAIDVMKHYAYDTL